MKLFYMIVISCSLLFVFNIAIADSTINYDIKATNEESSNVMPDDEQILNDLTIKVNKLKEEAGILLENVDRESDRFGKLKATLLIDKGEGCYSTYPLKGLEILINGSVQEPALVMSEGRNDDAAKPYGNPDGVTISFGPGLKYSYSETAGSVFYKGGRIILANNFEAYTISDLEYISIKKEGIRLIAKDKPGGKSWDRYIYETNIYNIGDISLQIGDLIIYRSNVNKSLKGTYKEHGATFTIGEEELIWSDKSLTNNSAYKELMERTDCPQQ